MIITNTRIERDLEDVRQSMTRLVLTVRMPDKVFLDHELIKDGQISFEDFIVDLLPALPPASLEKILGGAVKLRLTQ